MDNKDRVVQDQAGDVGTSSCERAEDRMMKWFEYKHLPETLQMTSQRFFELARDIVCDTDPGPERTVALRKLLEAKDAAVRAKVHAGG